MKNKKSILLVVLLLAIGFAAVSTTLYINGSTNINPNQDDFNVYYSDAYVNGVQDKSVITDDTHISFTTELSTLGEKYVLDYEVVNGSKNYDAELTMSCTSSNDYLNITNEFDDETILKSQGIREGKLTLELTKSNAGEDVDVTITCTINANAVERTSLGIANRAQVVIEAEDDNGSTINAKAYEVLGDEQEKLIGILANSGLTSNSISTIIETNSEEYSEISLATYNLANAVSENETVAFVHFNEENKEWEYIASSKVDNPSEITVDFSTSKKIPIATTNDDSISAICSVSAGTEWTYQHKTSEQSFVTPCDGIYKIELWGAQGGYNDLINTSGKGAYTAGNIELLESKELFVYVGSKGGSTNQDENVGGYNGGGYSGSCPPNGTSYGYNYGGGGATDIRLVNGVWGNFDSLKSRIMVAAGGGGTSNYLNWSPGWKTFGGYAGGLVGQDGTGEYGDQIGGGATQTSYGINPRGSEYNGNFGYAVQYITPGYAGGGGGGYYGGANGFGTGGGGGSSFISGHTGCNAIAETSTSGAIKHTGTPNHYSGYVFTNTKLLSGNETVPSYDGKSKMTGNAGNGYAKITFISVN